MQNSVIGRKVFWILIIATATVGVWLLRPDNLYFLNDDFTHIALSANFKIFQHNLWRPVCDLSIMLDYLIWGKNAWGYHFTNLLLHIANTYFVWVFARQMAKIFDVKLPVYLFSAIASILFFVYAFHSETIYWIIGRSSSLGLLFALPACIFYIKRNMHKSYFVMSILFFQAGLFTYESIWVFPLLTILFSIYKVQQKQNARINEWKMNAIVWLVFVINLILKYIVSGRVISDYEGGNLVHFAPVSLVSGGIKLFLRTFLPPMQNEIIFAVFGVVVLLLFALIFLYTKKKKHIIFSLLLLSLLISYLPCISLSVDTHGVESERFLYFPSVFAVLIIAWLLVSLFQKYSIIVFVLFIGFHLWFLHSARQNYFQASLITKSAYQQINALQNKKRLFIDSLPGEVSGALVFRLGFKEGLQWMKHTGSADSVYVLSRKYLDAKVELANNYTLNSITINTDTFTNDGQKQLTALSQLQRDRGYNSVRDAYMIFKNGKWVLTDW